MAIGTPGGHGIPQTTSQMLLNVLDFGMSVQEAIEAPRVRVFEGTHVDIEDRVPADVRAKLEALGHALTVLPAFHWGVGGGQGVYRVARKWCVHRRSRPAPRWLCHGVVGMFHPPHRFPRVAPSSTGPLLTPASDSGRSLPGRRCRRR